MRRITPSRQIIKVSELAEMLTKGFEGKVTFSGRAFGIVGMGEHSYNFYESMGKFSLSRTKKGSRVENGSYLLENSQSHLYFKPREGASIESRYDEKHGDVISFSITLFPNAVLQIEPDPRDIEFREI